MTVDEAIHPLEEAMRPRDTALAPLEGHLRRSGEEDVEPQGVGAELGDDVVRRDGVAFRLRHDLAVVVDHSLGEQAGHRLVEIREAEVPHHLGPEPRIHEVQDRVLDPADVEVDGEPVRDVLGADRCPFLVGRRYR